MYVWRAVESEGEVLDILVQSRREKQAALWLLRKLLRKQGMAPEALVIAGWGPMARRRASWVSVPSTSRASERTIERRARMFRPDDENGRCRDFDRQDRPNASLLPMLPSPTFSPPAAT
jgi:transposase-like protein